MLIFVAILTAFPMLATDMYLPAVPSIQDHLHTSVKLVNFTLVAFFVIISITGLLFGPLSDRYGRKPIIIPGIGIFVVASLVCALSPNIYVLIGARIFQAAGCGAGLAIATAIVKDYFPAEKKEKAFAIIGALTGFVPAIAPSIGEQILRFTNWRGIFVILALLGVVTLIFSLLYRETNDDLSDESIPASLMNLLVVLKNPSFSRLVILFSLAPLGLMAFVGISPTIFIKGFGVSGSAYSLYFGTNAVICVLAALAYIRISQFVKPMKLISVSFIMCFTSGILLVTIGEIHPALFLASIAVSSSAFSLQRPPSMNLILEQQDRNTGSASSIMNSLMGLLGSMGLVIISLEWSNRIFVLGVINIILGLFSFFFWQYTKKRCRIPASMREK